MRAMRVRSGVGVLLLTAALGACGTTSGGVASGGVASGGTASGAAGGTTPATPATPSGASPSPTPTSPYALAVRDLPSGWRSSNSQGQGYRLTVCGVDIEPVAPTATSSQRFSQGALGPFLQQSIRVYRDDQVTPVVTALRQALAGCTRYQAKGDRPDSPTASFRVEPLDVPGLASTDVAWRQTSQGDLPITSDIVLARRGTSAVLLMSYALRTAPDPQVLATAYRALPAER
jgi:hypothetical protein